MSADNVTGVQTSRTAPSAFSSTSELATLVRERDWSKTPLGPAEDWPQSLRSVVNILLTSRYAMWMGWGEKLTMLYNDAYRPTLGIKHPWALGTPAGEVWAEIWQDIGPRIKTVLSTGQATYDEALLLYLLRSGFPEETYHTFSYSPLMDDTGTVSGMLCVVTEETDRIISERRMATLRELASALGACNTEAEVLAALDQQLGANDKDLPFTLTYLFDAGGSARLACVTGMPVGHPACPARIEPDAQSPWPVRELWSSSSTLLLNGLGIWQRSVPLPNGAWDRPPNEVTVVPIRQQGHDRPAGFLVIGINPYRRYDDSYAGFVDLVSGQIAAGIASARAYEEERRRAEALAELDHAKTQFFSNVSHEFRTPLTLMLAPLEDMLAKPGEQVGPENRETLAVVHRNGLRLLRLVNSLLDFSRLEAGRVRAQYVSTDLAMLTAELASNFRSAAERAGLCFRIDCRPLPEPAYVDREMWEKVVFNLLSNALKFTFEGGITVQIQPVGGLVELRVIDTGTGIPEHELPHVFERFHRVEGARGRTFEGSGIGLALVQELVRLHGGSIRLESVLGKGSTFVVSLPLGDAHLPPEQIGRPIASTVSTAVPAEAFVQEAVRWLSRESPNARSLGVDPAKADAAGADPGAETVLVADDNADMREYIRRLLGSRYNVLSAVNGDEALRLAHAGNPDLVLSDVMMPGLDGFSLLQALRDHPSTRTTPVILLSARAGEEARSEGMDAGADDYIVKPFGARELLARVGAHLKLARIRKDAETALRESEERFAAAFAEAPIGMILTTAGGRITETNRAFQDMLGYRREELLGREALDFTHVDERERISTFFQSSQGEIRGTAVIETRYIRKDGAAGWACASVTMRPGDDGTAAQVIAIVEDITERRRIEEALRISEQRLQQAFAQAPVGVAVLRRRDLVIELANVEYQKFFPGRQLLGRPLREAVPEMDHALLEIIDRVFRTGEPFVGNEYRIPLNRGGNGIREDCWFTFVYQPLEEADGEVSGIVIVAVDVSTHVRARQGLERANRELEEFAYVSSHDMQEPLRMVNIYTHLLLKSLDIEKTAETAEYAAFVRQGVLRMEHLIRDLLSYSRVIHSDGVPAGTADLAESLAHALQTLRPRIDETRAIITAGPLPVVRGDTTQIAHVFQNLFTNSLKYRKTDTRPEIHISAERAGNQWIVSVRDNGIGFEQKYAERIFGLFKRLHKEEYAGTGLGLAICQRIVERFGGRMWAEGRPDYGATFYFVLTAVEAQ